MQHYKAAGMLAWKELVTSKQFTTHKHISIEYIDIAHEQGGFYCDNILSWLVIIFIISSINIGSNVYSDFLIYSTVL